MLHVPCLVHHPTVHSTNTQCVINPPPRPAGWNLGAFDRAPAWRPRRCVNGPRWQLLGGAGQPRAAHCEAAERPCCAGAVCMAATVGAPTTEEVGSHCQGEQETSRAFSLVYFKSSLGCPSMAVHGGLYAVAYCNCMLLPFWLMHRRCLVMVRCWTF